MLRTFLSSKIPFDFHSFFPVRPSTWAALPQAAPVLHLRHRQIAKCQAIFVDVMGRIACVMQHKPTIDVLHDNGRLACSRE